MLRGVVVKAYNSFYYVQTGDKIFSCSLRGRFKKERFSLFVGDEVALTTVGQDKGVIEEILPRRGLLRRPMVANVDQVVLTFAAVNPNVNTALVDRFLAMAELSDLGIILCINKIDLANQDELQLLADVYQNIGYQVIMTSAKNGIGIGDLREKLSGKITAFAGPSGAGKSSLLNSAEEGLALVTGEVSEKIGRGRHTTRHAELLPISGGGFVVDTPGFSLTDFSDVSEAEIASCFPEFVEVASYCKFTTCLHFKEPQCAVKQAVEKDKIASSRYENYLAILKEIRENKRGY